jgi:hypothetical protein
VVGAESARARGNKEPLLHQLPTVLTLSAMLLLLLPLVLTNGALFQQLPKSDDTDHHAAAVAAADDDGATGQRQQPLARTPPLGFNTSVYMAIMLR